MPDNWNSPPASTTAPDRERDELMKIVHGVLHPDCSDADCIEGIYTDEELTEAILAAGWRAQ